MTDELWRAGDSVLRSPTVHTVRFYTCFCMLLALTTSPPKHILLVGYPLSLQLDLSTLHLPLYATSFVAQSLVGVYDR